MAVKHRENARHREAFEIYYQADRDGKATTEKLGIPEGTWRSWALWWDWRGRADKRDREATARAERDAIKRRAKMFADHAKAGALLRLRGTEYFQGKPVDSAGDAIKAVATGVRIERDAEGVISPMVVQVMNADADTLRTMLAQLRGGAAADGGADPEAAGGIGGAGEPGEPDEPAGIGSE